MCIRDSKRGRAIPVCVTQRNDYPPHALSVLDHDADFTLSSSSYGYWLLGGVPAPTSSGNSGCVVPLELFSPGTEHDPSSSLPSSFYGCHLLGGAPAPASSGDGGAVSIDRSPSAIDYDLSFLPIYTMVPLRLSLLMTVMPLCPRRGFRL